jgi:hypothetical protein
MLSIVHHILQVQVIEYDFSIPEGLFILIIPIPSV